MLKWGLLALFMFLFGFTDENTNPGLSIIYMLLAAGTLAYLILDDVLVGGLF